MRERLAALKVVVHVWFPEQDLPQDPAGKVLKRELHEEVVPSS